ncbi:hypothetical protein [Mumia zhuanghuii]|uniref:hypothetical protein n=1 Tax=Mumia zhuanghuii TaxID=2585211 RepID=UPI00129D197E|nr:hypothetical protein [Mumia zhuanghuii]
MRARTRLGALGRLVGAVALTAGSLALIQAPAVAADGTPAAGTVPFKCIMPQFNNKAFDYDAEVSVAGYRAAEGDPVTLRATLSAMPGVSPVALNKASMTAEVTVTVDGQAVTLEGTGTSSAAANAPVPVPEVSGTVTSDKTELPVTVTAFSFLVMGVGGECTASKELPALTVSDGPAPTTPPPATSPPTKAPTKTPTAAPTTAPPAGNPGKPAEGTVKFACTLTIGSKFDYNAKMSVSGYRAKEGDPVSLQAKMSKLPGIAPVPIDGSMEFTVDLTIGGTATALKATSNVTAAPNTDVSVPDLKGSVEAEGDELEVKASGFSFDFPSAGIGAECTGSGTLSKLGVSSEPPKDGGAGDGGGGGGATAGDTLPKTGGTDALPVIGLVAATLVFLGAAGIVWFPKRRSTPVGG